MSILSVDKISPIGSGTTITLNATEVKTGTEITVGTGASIFSPAGNTLTLGTNNVERIRIKNDGSVLIGTTTEGNSAANNLTIADSGSCGITIRSASSGTGNIYFSDAPAGAAQYDGYIQYNQNDRYLVLGTATAERLRITSAGDVGIGTAVPVTWSGGANLSIAAANGGQLELGKVSSGIRHYFWGDDDLNIGAGYANGSSTNLNFKVNGNNTRLRIDSSGRIGIDYTPSSGDGIFNVKVDGSNVLHIGHGSNKDNYFTCGASGIQVFRSAGTERLRISSAGSITKPYNPAFRARSSSGGWKSFGNTNMNIMPFNAEDCDNGGNYDTSTYKFTVPVSGNYYFYCQMQHDGTTTNGGTSGQMQIVVQGVAVIAYGKSGTQGEVVSCGTVWPCTAGNVVYCEGATNTSNADDWHGDSYYSYFTGYLIG